MYQNGIKGIPGVVTSDNDPTIAEWQKLQYGMFIHWGLYSELGGVWDEEPVTEGYSEQIKMWADISDEDYLDIANHFSAHSFDPDQICSLAKNAGMTYIVITTKHHDGFAMFDTDTTDYNIVDSTPYGKDPVKELSDACDEHGLKFGIYFSLIDWNEGHDYDHNNINPIPKSMEPMIKEQLKELMTNYGPIAEVWFDMSTPTLEQSKQFKGIIREYQPGAAINSRIWNNEDDFRELGDNEIPDVRLDGPWQTPASIYQETWGYRSWQERDNMSEKVHDLVKGLVSVQARGGNYLLNIGPRGDGSIVGFESDVLHAIGDWLDQHPDAVLGASATEFGGQSWGEVTVNDDNLFLHVVDWPEDGELTLPGLANKVTHVSEDGTSNKLDWHRDENDLVVHLPDSPTDDVLPVMKVEFKGELSVIPKSTVFVDSNKALSIGSDEINNGYNYADEGNYSNTEQTNVRKTVYVAAKNNTAVYIDLKADANENKRYNIKVGNHSQEVTGKELNDITSGVIDLPANEVLPLTITLADPLYANEDMDIEIKSVYLVPLSNTSSIKDIVKHYEEDGIDTEAAYILKTHLDAVGSFEKTEPENEMINPFKGLGKLLDYHKEQDMISDKSYTALKSGMNAILVNKASHVRPKQKQIDWQKYEQTAFIHYGINTYNEVEWGGFDLDPNNFQPTNLDTDQWAKALKESGFKLAMLTAKHHDGFLLYPSRYTDFSVASSSWQDGEGDVLREFVDSMRKYGLKIGIYLSPADHQAYSDEIYANGSDRSEREIPTLVDDDDRKDDSNFPTFKLDGTDYGKLFMNQLYEVLTEYGDIDEVWFDGAQGRIPGDAEEDYDWDSYYELINKLQPQAVIANTGDDVRWVGNESGFARDNEWSVVAASRDDDGSQNSYPSSDASDLGSRRALYDAVDSGIDYLTWWPAEVDVSIREGWFYHDDEEPKSVDELRDIYYDSVARNSVLLLNIPPNKEGKFADKDVERLKEWHQSIKEDLATNHAKDASITDDNGADNTDPENVQDNDYDMYWQAKSTKPSSITLSFNEAIDVDRVVLQENIKKGQQVESFAVDVMNGDDEWEEIYSNETIGYKRIITLSDRATAKKFRVRFLKSRSPVHVSNIGLFQTAS